MRLKDVTGEVFCVYEFIFPNGKRYIGITMKKPKDRWRKGKGYSSPKIKNAIEKYGWDNIEKNILYSGLTVEQASAMEQELISKYDTFRNGYNSSLGGDCAAYGMKHSQQTKDKISDYFRGRYVGEKNPMYGVHSNHICNADGKLPEEIRGKISQKAKKRFAMPDSKDKERMQSYNIIRMKKVTRICDNGEVKEFVSINAAAEELSSVTGIAERTCCSMIWSACNRTCGIIHGYVYIFSDKLTDDLINEAILKSTKYRCYRKRRIKCINSGDIFDSVVSAGRHYGINKYGIYRTLNGKQDYTINPMTGERLRWEYTESA